MASNDMIITTLDYYSLRTSTMAQLKNNKVQKKKILTKRDRIGKRVAKVHRAIARKKIDRDSKKKKARIVRRKLKQNEDD